MTVPRIDSEKKARLFNRANEYRLNNEFDKAYEAYKAIVEEDEQEAEAYWGMILSEYGVEYVEDPKDKKRVPTCHRTKVQSILSSTNYKQALQYADTERKFIYQDEAEVIDKLQKDIISISVKEKPYDVFICYKETENQSGERTQDSVLAQQIYEVLQEKGINTFFSRISLEDKIGRNYEPYIFGALKSAKVMVLVTTSNDHCNATWVKNEWKRFLNFMEEDKNKVIIPACYEMSAYELPNELASYQVQNLEKIGAVQDLVYGVTKILGKESRESNNVIINELLEEKNTREKRNGILIRGLLLSVICFVLFFGGLLSTTAPVDNGHVSMKFSSLSLRFQEYNLKFSVVWLSGMLIGFIAMIYGMIKGYAKPLCKRLLLLGFFILGLDLFVMKLWGFLLPGFKFYYGMIFILVFWIILSKLKLDSKRQVLIRLAILGVSCLLGFSNLGFEKEELTDQWQITSKNQIKVIDDYATIRKEATSSSEELGEVYQNMVFDIVSKEVQEEKIWYEITTLSGKRGFVSGSLVGEAVVIEVVDEYRNLRSGPGTNYKKIGKVYMSETYWGVVYKVSGNDIWYEIVLSDGSVGYVCGYKNDKSIKVIN